MRRPVGQRGTAAEWPGLRIDPAHPHHYIYEDGARYFQMGYEADWLGLIDLGDVNATKSKTLVDMLASNGFNEVIMNAYAYDTTWKAGITSTFDFGPPKQFAWAGSNTTPDHTKMNEAFWQNYDRVIAYLFEKGVTAHIFFKVYNKQVNWPAKNSVEEDMYFKFLTARYEAYSNIVWDFTKEAFYETDQTYIANRLAFIRTNDAYQRLRTIHDSDGGQSQHPNYYDVASHKSTFEFYTDQHVDHIAQVVCESVVRLRGKMGRR